jgi:hypothetical protein
MKKRGHQISHKHKYQAENGTCACAQYALCYTFGIAKERHLTMRRGPRSYDSVVYIIYALDIDLNFGASLCHSTLGAASATWRYQLGLGCMFPTSAPFSPFSVNSLRNAGSCASSFPLVLPHCLRCSRYRADLFCTYRGAASGWPSTCMGKQGNGEEWLLKLAHQCVSGFCSSEI